MLNKFFKRSEFACKCKCGFSVVDVDLLNVLTMVREYFNSPVTINSACRCESHNKSVGGADGSKHKLGIAADIAVKGVKPSDVYECLCAAFPDKYGIGNYNSFTHIDIRDKKARW